MYNKVYLKGGDQVYYTLREAAKKLGIAVRTLRGWIKRGKLKAIKSEKGYMWLISEDAIKEANMR